MAGLPQPINWAQPYNQTASYYARGYRYDPNSGNWINPSTGRSMQEEQQQSQQYSPLGYSPYSTPYSSNQSYGPYQPSWFEQQQAQQAEWAHQQALASQNQSSSMAQLQAQLAAQEAARLGTQGWQSNETQAERDQRMREMYATQDYQRNQSATDWARQQAAQASTQNWQGSQNAADRSAQLNNLKLQLAQQKELQNSSQGWQSGENAAQRAASIAELEKQIAAQERAQASTQNWQTAERAGTQAWQSGETAAERALRMSLQEGTQAWQSGESAADRAFQAQQMTQNQNWQGEQNRSAAQERMAELQATITAQQGMATQAQQAEMAQLQTQIGANQQAATAQWERAQQAQQGLYGMLNDTMTRFGIAGQPAAGTSGTGATQEQENAADAASFAAEKDKIGLINRAAQDDISQNVVARGIGGSGIEAGMRAGQFQAAQGNLGQVARDQATQKRQRAYQVADRDVATGLQRRAQDIGLTTSMGSLLKMSGY